MMAPASSGKKTRSKQKGKAAAFGSACGRGLGQDAAELDGVSSAHLEVWESAAAGELPEEAPVDSLATLPGTSGRKQSPAGERQSWTRESPRLPLKDADRSKGMGCFGSGD